MAEPPLATIQAAICACSVLASSLDEVAQSFASVHLARCVSVSDADLEDARSDARSLCRRPVC